MNQIAERKQRHGHDGAQQVEIMANAISGSPTHSREDTKRFEQVSKNNDDKRRCAKQLEDGGHALSSQPNDR
jgi:cell division protein FtsB